MWLWVFWWQTLETQLQMRLDDCHFLQMINIHCCNIQVVQVYISWTNIDIAPMRQLVGIKRLALLSPSTPTNVSLLMLWVWYTGTIIEINPIAYCEWTKYVSHSTGGLYSHIRTDDALWYKVVCSHHWIQGLRWRTTTWPADMCSI